MSSAVDGAGKDAGTAANPQCIVEMPRLQELVGYIHKVVQHVVRLGPIIASGAKLLQEPLGFSREAQHDGTPAEIAAAALEAGEKHLIVRNRGGEEERVSIARLPIEPRLNQRFGSPQALGGLLHLAQVAPE